MKANVAVKYERLTTLFRKMLHGLVVVTKSHTLHSLRAGGATAASNKGVAKELIAKQGGWTSSCVDVYIKEARHTRAITSVEGNCRIAVFITTRQQAFLS